MKKSLLLSCLVLCSTATLAQTYKGITTCEFDYDGFKFCSKTNIQKYKNALATKKPNFDEQYILINVSSRSNIRYVALDTKTGIAYPLSDEIQGFKNSHGFLTGKPSSINYSLYNTDLCIEGSVSAYRNSYDNVKVCYSIQKDASSPYGKDFNRVNMPKEIND
ncbi:hypothetical protein [Acinetobacter sp. MB5]|uniref:hypothetical protein n=1 Tax=Acinetobacter sp. MB5 TaxID=2069438 RepID=UPI000DCF831E|nr:hypothetical protein [Acinetobacter sp. MB5]